jgi:hypothetical protein
VKKAYQRLVVEIDGSSRSIREDVLKNPDLDQRGHWRPASDSVASTLRNFSTATLGSVLLVSIIVLFSATGSSAHDYPARTAIGARPALAPELKTEASAHQRQSPPVRELSKEKMLAWFLLLMKDGAGAR